MEACAIASGAPLVTKVTALGEQSGLRQQNASRRGNLALPAKATLHRSGRSLLVVPNGTSNADSSLGTSRRPLEHSTRSHRRKLETPYRQRVVTCSSNGKSDDAPENGKSNDAPVKRKPTNKMVTEPTVGDKVMTVTTKLLNVTVYPLAIAGLVTVLPVVWGIRLYKAITTEPIDMKNKVVLVAGGSSGIGEHMAYEYASMGARLALVARRGEKLEEVAEEARLMGSPDVQVIEQDLGTEEGCKAAVEETMKHFKTIDTLALNAGIFHIYMFEDATDTKRFDSIMDINFWGYVYMTHYSLEHLKKSGGQIIVNSSVSALVPQPRNSLYNAAKAAVTNFFHTLRIELGDQVPITIFSPGVTKSELSDGKVSQAEGKVPNVEKALDLRNEQLGIYPIVPTAYMARAAVKAARYKKHDVTIPVWYNMLAVYRSLAPEAIDAGLRWFIVRDPPMAKRIIDTLHLDRVGQPSEEDLKADGIPGTEGDKPREKNSEKAGSRR